jgi:hypothetical protein
VAETLETLAVSHWHAGGDGTLHKVPVGHAFPDELCVLVADRQMMQSPGSIFGFGGTKTRLTPFPIWTVGVRGAARFAQAAGVAPNAQLGVMQVWADAGLERACHAIAETMRTRMDARMRAMAYLLECKMRIALL